MGARALEVEMDDLHVIELGSAGDHCIEQHRRRRGTRMDIDTFTRADTSNRLRSGDDLHGSVVHGAFRPTDVSKGPTGCAAWPFLSGADCALMRTWAISRFDQSVPATRRP